MYKIIQHSPHAKIYPNLSTPITIGRSRRNHIHLKGKNISRKHCQIFETKGSLFLQDLKSVNGTFLQGQSVGLKKIELGTPFSVGNQVLTLVVQESSEVVSQGFLTLPHWLVRTHSAPRSHWLATTPPPSKKISARLKKMSARLVRPKRPRVPKPLKVPVLTRVSFGSAGSRVHFYRGILMGLLLFTGFALYWRFGGNSQKPPKTVPPELFSLRQLPPEKRPYFQESTRQSIQNGIDYLLRHQQPDGSWDPHQFTKLCVSGRCTETGEPYNVVGITGLVLLVLLAEDGLTQPRYQSACAKALQFLLASQQEDGLWGNPQGKYTYNHAIATLGVAEAMSLSPQPRWSVPLKKALTKIIALQNEDGGWRYGLSSKEISDLAVTGWMIQALFMGRKAQVPLSAVHFLKAQEFLQTRFSTKAGRAFYLSPQEIPLLNASGTDSLTATYWICASLFQQKIFPQSLLLLTSPEWRPKRVNYYYWLRGSEALRMTRAESYESWYQYLAQACVPHQEKKGCASGSFPPIDVWSTSGGRLYSTAMAILALQSSYRYHPEASWITYE